MPNYNNYKALLLDGTVDFIADDIRVALLTNAYIPDLDHEFFNDLENKQIVDSGYGAGGELLANKSVFQDGKKSYYRADNLQWQIDGNVNVKFIILYKDTGDSETSPLIAFIELDPSRVVVGATLAVNWDALGIIQLY